MYLTYLLYLAIIGATAVQYNSGGVFAPLHSTHHTGSSSGHAVRNRARSDGRSSPVRDMHEAAVPGRSTPREFPPGNGNLRETVRV